MKQTAVEFSRPLAVDRVPPGGCDEAITADAGECGALARRLAVPAIHAVSARLRVEPWRGGGLKVEGAVAADLEQVSVVSLEQFRHRAEFPLVRYFLPGGADAGGQGDVDPIMGGEIDLGEIAAETLALELDPYPRRPGEAFESVPESAPPGDSPFAALSKLKGEQ